MFTGIIEEIGTMQKIHKQGSTLVLNIQASKILSDVHLGDSIAVNGVCLTVTEFSGTSFSVDVMPETFNSTSLAMLKPGSKVNLERAMAAGGRFGGHFVSGHVDGTGTIKAIKPEENAVYYTISVPKDGIRYCLHKGSVALDGTSLTIFYVKDSTITVSLIPHTRGETILGNKRVGDMVNIEFDLLGKYVFSMIEQKSEDEKQSTGITADFLKQTGFM
ncbi:riboflavin synthase [Bacillus marasmi]|uniref:riboflavin synthase n=1 Tax=Bacillus marasmi TaxID=1926279 RepID=UPI0011CC451D|nr:riboflavin synthase [Bacillus marasmi]